MLNLNLQFNVYKDSKGENLRVFEFSIQSKKPIRSNLGRLFAFGYIGERHTPSNISCFVPTEGNLLKAQRGEALTTESAARCNLMFAEKSLGLN